MKIVRISLVFSLFLSFSSALHAKGAGILAIFDDAETLVGKETRIYKHGPQKGQKYEVLGDCGGGADKNETLAQTALREFLEETAHYTFGVGSPYNIKLNHVLQAEAKGHFADHNHPATGQSYRIYFVRIHGKKPSIQTFHKNAALAKRRLGKKAHVEKTEWMYVDAQVLKNAAFQNGNLPGTTTPLYKPFKAVLRQASAQNFLQTVVPLPAPKPTPAPMRKPTSGMGNHKRKTVHTHPKQKRVKQQGRHTHIKQRGAKSKTIRSSVKQRHTRHKSVRTPVRQRVTKHKGSRSRVNKVRQTK